MATQPASSRELQLTDHRLVTYSAQLMSNFQQAEVAAPQANFDALQTDDGYSLLFSQGTDGVLYVTQELPGHASGWERTDLIAQLSTLFGDVQTRAFAVAQNLRTKKIDVALGLRVGDADRLFVALGNSSSDTSWLAAPPWQEVPYDDDEHPLAKLVIHDMFISQASNREYLVVDVLRDPSDPTPVIRRFFIDPAKKLTGKAWIPRDVAADVDAADITSCLGRRLVTAGDGWQEDTVDGIYTLGTIGEHIELFYQPLYNPFKPKIAPNTTRLTPPPGGPRTMAAAAVEGNATALFVASGETLYCYAPNAQQNDAAGTPLIANALFEDASQLFACASDETVVVWGLNRAQQVFYTSCPRAEITNASAWSHPLPILEHAERISPYVNGVDDANTFFAHTGVGRMQKAVQSPATTVWTYQDILLPAPLTATALKFDSYTTQLQVTDDERKPLAGAPVQLAAEQWTGLSINNRYYVLSPEPIAVTTDQVGAITIVEPVSTLQATQILIHGGDGQVITINPMDAPMEQIAELDTPAQLAGATIEFQDGATKPLIDPSTSPADQQRTVDAIGSLASAYATLPYDDAKRATVRPVSALGAVPSRYVVSLYVRDGALATPATEPETLEFGSAIAVAAGNLLDYLDSATDYVVHIVEDAAGETWHFVAEIAGAVYSFVLDAASTVLGALEVVFNAIKTAIEDLIAFLRFLFNWAAMTRTKDVFKQVVTLDFRLLIEDVDTLKADINGLLEAARSQVDLWAHVKQDTWEPSLPDHRQPIDYMRTITDVSKLLTAPAMFLFQHVLNNAMDATGTDTGRATVLEELLDRAVQALEAEGDIFIDAARRIDDELLKDGAYASMALDELLSKLLAIVVDALLNSAENAIDAVLDVFVIVLDEIAEAFDAPIWIPVVSDILADFGVKFDVSMLDIACYVGAIPATLGYEVFTGKAPFHSGDGFSNEIIAAPTAWALAAALGQREPPVRPAAAGPGPGAVAPEAEKHISPFVPIKLTTEQQDVIFIAGHLVGGIAGLINAPLRSADAMSDMKFSALGSASSYTGAVSSVSTSVARLFAEPMPLQNKIVLDYAGVVGAINGLGTVVFGLAPFALKANPRYSPAKGAELAGKAKIVGAGFGTLMGMLLLVPIGAHLYELAEADPNEDRTEAILDAVAQACANLGRIGYFFTVIDEEPVSKVVLGFELMAIIGLAGGLQIAEAVVELA